MFVHPGKKLLFMGAEIGQWREWNHDGQLDWEVLGDSRHAGLQHWVRDLNRVYREEPSLWSADDEPSGFQWIDCDDAALSVLALMRRSATNDLTIAVVNFTPVPRPTHRVGVPVAGRYRELLNSDADIYGGSNLGNAGEVETKDEPAHGHPYSLTLVVPPLGFVLLKPNSSAPDQS
jgi:1,4-alpha-glucan branching enzyme